MGHVLVAGGAGFVGSHLVDRLVQRGDSVVVVDNLSSGRRENIAHLETDPRFTFVECDVVRHDVSSVLDAATNGTRFDAVMNLASPASPPEYLRRPIDTLDVGSIGTRNLLELAKRDRSRFFLASTSEVYGDPLEHPQRETYWGNVNPIGARSVYDEAKRFAEALTMAYHREYGLDVRIVRIFNTYGPRMQLDDGRVVTNFVRQAIVGEPLTLYGDGMQTRSFCYVDDEVTGLLALLDGDEVGPVNIGNPNEITVAELANMIVELANSTSTVEFLPLPSDDPRIRQPDITIARERLGWEPQVDLRTGLTAMIVYCRSVLDQT